mmetsp:Transcript_25622/g.60958  ORF Transcript_25622/g.60958 Transcript_25622/m.60958 type:complete len:347 (-) Transcript_25622:162-1202(-)
MPNACHGCRTSACENASGSCSTKNSVCSVVFAWIIRLPSRCREDVLVFVVPMPLHHLSRVRLVLLLCGVVREPHVFVDVKVEKRPALPPRLVDDELVERHVGWDYEVLLDVHQVGDLSRPHLAELGRELLADFPKEVLYRVALADIDLPPVPAAVPVAVGDLEGLLLDPLLLLLPLPLELGAQLLLLLLALPVRQEVRLDLGVLPKLLHSCLFIKLLISVLLVVCERKLRLLLFHLLLLPFFLLSFLLALLFFSLFFPPGFFLVPLFQSHPFLDKLVSGLKTNSFILEYSLQYLRSASSKLTKSRTSYSLFRAFYHIFDTFPLLLPLLCQLADALRIRSVADVTHY